MTPLKKRRLARESASLDGISEEVLVTTCVNNCISDPPRMLSNGPTYVGLLAVDRPSNGVSLPLTNGFGHTSAPSSRSASDSSLSEVGGFVSIILFG